MAKTAAALVVAAGRGSRLADPRTSLPKQYRLLAGRPVLTHTLNALGNHPRISHMLTVIHPDDIGLYDDAISAANENWSNKLMRAVFGSETRQGSVREGLKALSAVPCDYVLIHDAARPFLTHDVIDGLLGELDTGAEGALAATQVVDTLKKQKAPGHPLETVDRQCLWAAQTPQAFPLSRISRAHENAAQSGHTNFTDDTSLAEWDGMTVVLSAGDPANFKITTAADLRRAAQQASLLTMPQAVSTDLPLSELTDIRTGIGYDVHAFEDGDAVILGGVAVPHTQKLKGHSDADVVLHAITDATLGAIGDGDIGQHFPPSDPMWKGASSDRFQQDAIRRLAERGGRIAHIDVTIVCEEPKIGPHRDKIRVSIAGICHLPVSRVSVKATTSERLGFTGRKEGIAALASVTVRLPFEEGEGGPL
ncbi:bifunctional 2-C-methyl-D-erythritol 4-phosphate cytidylyltransferase/2-C-methyl-D-erythritol 2,4-cyclodiphosphate synthase [Roseibium marinum]|uniref:Bifunctional enzyme IspD/IspF n=1 Tax=Roseibium marinum TaxID=281252 RepID=A0A2S3UR68_9HYPH|nr:bifunctional 2-C-methyl-D-erythritol 4-phosphate cytidylyltransferase/2-C-methyl-D-erythritol 2,4-cyclodiphosphate synthase [Roseibium marinum]POF30070.1 2-C-methyl-D-erythritol 4-phosphate cytidylyltransferase/2-C-methyl-D-erythritol 2,4-cyclodiphosphate synthase [Roseibium marinum]